MTKKQAEIGELTKAINRSTWAFLKGSFVTALAKDLYKQGYRKINPIRLCTDNSELTYDDAIVESACHECTLKTTKEVAAEIVDQIKKLQAECYNDAAIFDWLENRWGLKGYKSFIQETEERLKRIKEQGKRRKKNG